MWTRRRTVRTNARTDPCSPELRRRGGRARSPPGCRPQERRTTRTEVLFGPAGRAYVYLIYEMYEIRNVVAGNVGEAQAVLIRAARLLTVWNVDLSGPGRLTRAFKITRSHYGLDNFQRPGSPRKSYASLFPGCDCTTIVKDISRPRLGGTSCHRSPGPVRDFHGQNVITR